MIPLNKQPRPEDLCEGTAPLLCNGTGPIETIEEYDALTGVYLERHRVWGLAKPDPLGRKLYTARNYLQDIIGDQPSEEWLRNYFKVWLKSIISWPTIRNALRLVWEPNYYRASESGADRKGRKPKPR